MIILLLASIYSETCYGYYAPYLKCLQCILHTENASDSVTVIVFEISE